MALPQTNDELFNVLDKIGSQPGLSQSEKTIRQQKVVDDYKKRLSDGAIVPPKEPQQVQQDTIKEPVVETERSKFMQPTYAPTEQPTDERLLSNIQAMKEGRFDDISTAEEEMKITDMVNDLDEQTKGSFLRAIGFTQVPDELEKNIEELGIEDEVMKRFVQLDEDQRGGVLGLLTGAGKGALSTLKGIGKGEKIIQKIVEPFGVPVTDTTASERLFPSDEELEPVSRAESIGKGIEQVAEFFVPGAQASKIAKTAQAAKFLKGGARGVVITAQDRPIMALRGVLEDAKIPVDRLKTALEIIETPEGELEGGEKMRRVLQQVGGAGTSTAAILAGGIKNFLVGAAAAGAVSEELEVAMASALNSSVGRAALEQFNKLSPANKELAGIVVDGIDLLFDTKIGKFTRDLIPITSSKATDIATPKLTPTNKQDLISRGVIDETGGFLSGKGVKIVPDTKMKKIITTLQKHIKGEVPNITAAQKKVQEAVTKISNNFDQQLEKMSLDKTLIRDAEKSIEKIKNDLMNDPQIPLLRGDRRTLDTLLTDFNTVFSDMAKEGNMKAVRQAKTRFDKDTPKSVKQAGKNAEALTLERQYVWHKMRQVYTDMILKAQEQALKSGKQVDIDAAEALADMSNLLDANNAILSRASEVKPSKGAIRKGVEKTAGIVGGALFLNWLFGQGRE